MIFLQQPRIITSGLQYNKPEKKDWKGHLLCILETGGEHDMGPPKRVIMDWAREIKSRPEVNTEWHQYFIQVLLTAC